MKIAVLSGKGGTGKTMVSVNLSAVAGRGTYIDCDVEEPNGHLFFRPQWDKPWTVSTKVPVVDQEMCTGCKNCVEFCNFNALALAGNKLVIFEDICHSCGGCVLVCPHRALSEKDRAIGTVNSGNSGDIAIYSGELTPGQPSGVPIIQKLIQLSCSSPSPVVIDCPPGSACTVMESIADADYCLLVAEPTVFGAHNLELVHQLVTLFDKPHGAVLNKCTAGANPSEDYCRAQDIPVLVSIPFDPALGKLTSDGLIAANEDSNWQTIFASLLETVQREAAK